MGWIFWMNSRGSWPGKLVAAYKYQQRHMCYLWRRTDSECFPSKIPLLSSSALTTFLGPRSSTSPLKPC